MPRLPENDAALAEALGRGGAGEAGEAGDPAGLTRSERQRLRRLLARREPGERYRTDWPAATPPPADLLERLGPRLHPVTGMPLGRDYLPPSPGKVRPPQAPPPLELPGQRDYRTALEFSAWSAWAELTAQEKTAVAAH